MKKILFIMAAFAVLFSCSKESLTQKDNEGKEYTIGLMPVGDITALYSPLTKSGEEKTWYGINIKRDGSDYLFGIYDDISKFMVQLSTEHYYSFEVSAIKTDIEVFEEISFIYSYRGVGYTVYTYSPMFPFDFEQKLYYAGYIGNWNNVHDDPNARLPKSHYLNKLYSNLLLYTDYFNSLYDLGTQASASAKSTVYSLAHLSNGNNTDEWYRFYGTKNNFTPSKDETLPFALKHEGFGLQYSVSGICDGSVSVVIDNAQSENTVTYFSQPALTTNYSSPQKVIEFRDMTAETEQVKVTVVWTRGNNVVDDLGSTTVNVRRNKVNKINISLGEHSANKSMSVSTDASDYFGSENKDITI